MLSESLQHGRRNRNRARLIVLQCAELIPPFDLVQLAVNPHNPAFPVDTVPRKAEDFTHSHSRKQINSVDQLKRMPLNATQKVGYLRAVHRLNLCFLHARQFAHVRGIHLNQTDFNGLLQRPVKRAVRIVNRFRGKLAQAVCAAIERIIQVLNLAGGQVTELDFPQIRNKAIADG